MKCGEKQRKRPDRLYFKSMLFSKRTKRRLNASAPVPGGKADPVWSRYDRETRRRSRRKRNNGCDAKKKSEWRLTRNEKLSEETGSGGCCGMEVFRKQSETRMRCWCDAKVERRPEINREETET